MKKPRKNAKTKKKSIPAKRQRSFKNAGGAKLKKRASKTGSTKTRRKPTPKAKPRLKASEVQSQVFEYYDSLKVPEDVKEFLKSLFLKRKKKGRAFKIPNVGDARKYLKVINNLKNPKMVLYWNVPIEIIKEDIDTSYRVVGFTGRTEYKGYSKVEALNAVNYLNRFIDKARFSASKKDGPDNYFGYVPVIFFKRDKLFNSKERPIFRVEMNYSNLDVSDDVMDEVLKLYRNG